MCLDNVRGPTKEEIATVKEGYKVFIKNIPLTVKTYGVKNGTGYLSVFVHLNIKNPNTTRRHFEYKGKRYFKTSEPGFHVFLTKKDAETYMLTECIDPTYEYTICKVKVKGLLMFGLQKIIRYHKIDTSLKCFTCAQLKIMEEI